MKWPRKPRDSILVKCQALALSLLVSSLAACGASGSGATAPAFHYIGSASYRFNGVLGDGFGTVTFSWSVGTLTSYASGPKQMRQVLKMGPYCAATSEEVGNSLPGQLMVRWKALAPSSSIRTAIPVIADMEPADGASVDTAWRLGTRWNCAYGEDPLITLHRSGTLIIPFAIDAEGNGSVQARRPFLEVGFDIMSSGMAMPSPTITGPNAATCEYLMNPPDVPSYRIAFLAKPPFVNYYLTCQRL